MQADVEPDAEAESTPLHTMLAARSRLTRTRSTSTGASGRSCVIGARCADGTNGTAGTGMGAVEAATVAVMRRYTMRKIREVFRRRHLSHRPPRVRSSGDQHLPCELAGGEYCHGTSAPAWSGERSALDRASPSMSAEGAPISHRALPSKTGPRLRPRTEKSPATGCRRSRP